MSVDSSQMASNNSFDPFTQNFTLLDQTGSPFNITMADLDDFYLYSVQICINYAAQLGASLVLLIAMILLTKAEKRPSPIFIINSFALAANFVRLLLLCLFYTGPLSEPYAYFAFDYSRVPPSAFYTSVTAETLTLLTLILVEISLLLQVQVVCITVAKVYRYSILAVSTIIGTLAIGFRLSLCIVNNINILDLGDPTSFQWLDKGNSIVTTISVCWFSLAFATKLGLALRQRKKLGLRRWSPMHVLFVMGCQTLIIPAIFSILQFCVDIPATGSNLLTLVALFMPLSALWASSTLGSKSKESTPQPRTGFRALSSRSGSTTLFSRKKLLSPTASRLKSSTFSQLSTVDRHSTQDHPDLRDSKMEDIEAGHRLKQEV